MDMINHKGLRAVAMLGVAALGSVGSASAQMSGEKLPFYVSVSETVTHDTNFSRTDQGQKETILTTALLAGLAKSYGRQQYNLSAQYANNRYQNFKELLNNDSKYLSGSFSSDFLANWELSAGGSHSESLNPIRNNVNAERVTKNIRTYNDRYLTVRYGLDGFWSISGSVNANTVRYSRESYRNFDADQESTSVRVNYYPVGNVVLGVGYRPVETTYINSSNRRKISDNNIDWTASWRVSGLSSFSAQYTRKRSEFSDSSQSGNRTWSGNVSWNYTPGGIWSYGFNASRYNSTDRLLDTGLQGIFGPVSPEAFGQRDVLLGSTTYSANVGAALTGKLSLRGSYSISKNRFNFSQVYRNLNQCLNLGSQQIGYCDSTRDVNNIQHTTGLTLTYLPTRSVTTQCNLQVYSQTRDRFGFSFKGRSVDCSVKLTLDALSPLFDGWFE